MTSCDLVDPPTVWYCSSRHASLTNRVTDEGDRLSRLIGFGIYFVFTWNCYDQSVQSVVKLRNIDQSLWAVCFPCENRMNRQLWRVMWQMPWFKSWPFVTKWRQTSAFNHRVSIWYWQSEDINRCCLGNTRFLFDIDRSDRCGIIAT